MPEGDSPMTTAGEEIRLITYLSPSIPRALFEALTEHLQRALGRERVSLEVETRISGPQKGEQCSPLGTEADVAFMCAPSFFWLRELQPPPMELLGVLPVFDDERNQGKPVYFCDVVVRHDSPTQAFSDLQGGSWYYNDACSLSGYYSLLDKLAESGTDESFFDRVICSGSHLNSIEAILRGEADAAAIDSNVLRIRLREVPDLQERLRVIESWGPYPIQPVVVDSALDPALKARLRTAFLATEDDQHTQQVLEQFGLTRFVAVDQEDYTLAAHKDLVTLITAR
jgi:ABC-type phosphate/phosphonate transport system substrate-binding protein